MRRLTDDLLAVVVIITSILVLAGALWALYLVLAPVPAASEPPHRTAVTRSEGRPPMSAREYVALASIAQGWDERQWRCLVALITIENPSWNPRSLNSSSGASGIFQVMPNPSGHLFRDYALKDQVRLGAKYVASRYGMP